MIGLFAFALIGTVAWLCWKCIDALAKKIQSKVLRRVFKFGMVTFLVLAAFLDEVVGMHEFNSLCASQGIRSADLRRFEGRSVKIAYGDRQPVTGSILPIRRSHVVYRDVTILEPAFSHHDFYAEGGWLMRYTFLSMGRSGPMLFRGNGCGINEQLESLKAHRIEVVAADFDNAFEPQTVDGSQA